MLVCALPCASIAHETAGAARTRSSLRPLVFGAELICKPRAKCCRENADSCLLVVPANAGTHSPWHWLEKKASTAFSKRDDTAYGSPAFAGTTRSGCLKCESERLNVLILRRRASAVSKDGGTWSPWFETREDALLTMRCWISSDRPATPAAAIPRRLRRSGRAPRRARLRRRSDGARCRRNAFSALRWENARRHCRHF
jgi:hypothetical protein